MLMLVIGMVFWGGLALSSLMKRYHAGTQVKAAGGVNVWSGVSVGPNDAIAGQSVADDGELAGRESDWDDVFVLIWAGSAGVLATVPRRRTGSKYLNTLLGAIAGMPIAVCTNCVAPIARGLYAAGMSRESVLAAMFASPALNVVVLAMTFAIVSGEGGVVKACDGVVFDFLYLRRRRRHARERKAIPARLTFRWRRVGGRR